MQYLKLLSKVIRFNNNSINYKLNHVKYYKQINNNILITLTYCQVKHYLKSINH
jgi:hypothetical protein